MATSSACVPRLLVLEAIRFLLVIQLDFYRRPYRMRPESDRLPIVISRRVNVDVEVNVVFVRGVDRIEEIADVVGSLREFIRFAHVDRERDLSFALRYLRHVDASLFGLLREPTG
jgi:hypothetical protein